MTADPEIVVYVPRLSTGKSDASFDRGIVTATGATPDEALAALQRQSRAVAHDLATDAYGSAETWRNASFMPSRVNAEYAIANVRLAYGATDSVWGWTAYGTLRFVRFVLVQ
jgi:hypothetical protein